MNRVQLTEGQAVDGSCAFAFGAAFRDAWRVADRA